MDPLTHISPVQDGPPKQWPGLTLHSAPHSVTECGALAQGRCHEYIALSHYARPTHCQPGPLQHLNTDRKDNKEDVGSVGSKHMRCEDACMACCNVNETNCKHDMLTYTHYTSVPYLYSPQHSLKETQNSLDAAQYTSSSCKDWLWLRLDR